MGIPLIISLLLFLSVGLSQQEYNSNELIEMDNGLWTEWYKMDRRSLNQLTKMVNWN